MSQCLFLNRKILNLMLRPILTFYLVLVQAAQRNFTGYPEIFQEIQKLSGPSRKYPDYPESFQDIQKFSRVSETFPDHPVNIKTIQKLSRPSGNFPDCPESSKCNFKGNAQKLSRWQCHDAMMVFGTLPRLIWIKSKRTADFFFVRMSLRNNLSSEKNYNDFLFSGNLSLVGFLLYEVY